MYIPASMSLAHFLRNDVVQIIVFACCRCYLQHFCRGGIPYIGILSAGFYQYVLYDIHKLTFCLSHPCTFGSIKYVSLCSSSMPCFYQHLFYCILYVFYIRNLTFIVFTNKRYNSFSKVLSCFIVFATYGSRCFKNCTCNFFFAKINYSSISFFNFCKHSCSPYLSFISLLSSSTKVFKSLNCL